MGGVSQASRFSFLIHGWCSFCQDSDKLRCRDDPWADVVGLNSLVGVSPAVDDKVSEELKEVARLCMLRDFVSLALTSDSCVTVHLGKKSLYSTTGVHMGVGN